MTKFQLLESNIEEDIFLVLKRIKMFFYNMGFPMYVFAKSHQLRDVTESQQIFKFRKRV